MSGPEDREGAPDPYPIGDRLAERLNGAHFHGTVRAAVQTAMRDEA